MAIIRVAFDLTLAEARTLFELAAVEAVEAFNAIGSSSAYFFGGYFRGHTIDAFRRS